MDISLGDYIEYSKPGRTKRVSSFVKKKLTNNIVLTSFGDLVNITCPNTDVINKVYKHTTGYDFWGNITHQYIRYN